MYRLTVAALWLSDRHQLTIGLIGCDPILSVCLRRHNDCNLKPIDEGCCWHLQTSPQNLEFLFADRWYRNLFGPEGGRQLQSFENQSETNFL